jgi:hypothetical protein
VNILTYQPKGNLVLLISKISSLLWKFLNWKFGDVEQTIVHCVATNGNLDTLHYVLGFFPDIDNLKDKSGKTPYDYGDRMPGANLQILLQYQQQPKKFEHPQYLLELPNKPAASKNDLASFLSDIFDKKVLGLLGTFFVLGLLYRYGGNKDKDKTAAE